jgi:hypothetical protein
MEMVAMCDIYLGDRIRSFLARLNVLSRLHESIPDVRKSLCNPSRTGTELGWCQWPGLMFWRRYWSQSPAPPPQITFSSSGRFSSLPQQALTSSHVMFGPSLFGPSFSRYSRADAPIYQSYSSEARALRLNRKLSVFWRLRSL